MRKRNIWGIAVLIALVIGITLAVIYNDINWKDGTSPPYHPLGYIWENGGTSITALEVEAVEHYTALDEREYTAEPGGKLILVRLKATLAPGWKIDSFNLYGPLFSKPVSPLSEQIKEIDADGQETQILLFSIPTEDYDGRLEWHSLNMNVAHGWRGYDVCFHFHPVD